MKKIFLSLVMMTMGCFASLSSYAFEPMNIPPMADYVVDHAGVLSAIDLQSLNQQAKNLETPTSAQIATALIPEHGDYAMLDVGLKLFRDTGLGQKTKNNGLLLLISTSDKKIRIVVGYGLEGEIPDIVARDIIETSVRPLVNSGDYVGAIQAYYQRVDEIITQGVTIPDTNNEQNTMDSKNSINFVFWVFILAYVAGQSYRRWRKDLKKNKESSSGSFWFIFIISLIVTTVAAYIVSIIASIVIYIFGLIIGFIVGNFRGLGGGGFGGFGGGGFGGGGFGGGGGFSGGGGSSGGGGAGD